MNFIRSVRWCSRTCLDDNDIKQFESTMKQRFFYYPTAHLYGSTSGLFDFGPYGTSVKWNLVESWKKYFIDQQEDVYAIETSSVVPEKVLQASGHVQKFQDILVKDTVSFEYLRVDHLIQEHLEKQNKGNTWNDLQKIVYSNNLTKIKELLIDLNLTKNPATSNDLSDPLEFNLMFQTKIGVEGSRNAFLRPELAQGIFINFVHLIRQTDGSLPFGVGSVGNVFRNETSARQGLLRTREFTLAEMEYFFNPNEIYHPKYNEIPKDFKLPVLSAKQQEISSTPIMTSIQDIKQSNLVDNEILLYFMYKAFHFLISNGIREDKIRIRQHLSDEMAHYASDCWDIEIHTLQYGWIECVGIANRTNYDLSRHIEFGNKGNQLLVFVPFPDGKSYKEKQTILKPNQPQFGKTFKSDSSTIAGYLGKLSANQLSILQKELNSGTKDCFIEIDGRNFNLHKDCVSFSEIEVNRTGDHIIPHVIEPSFGINRILYCILEHSYRIRDVDSSRNFLSLPYNLVPVHCEVLVMKKNDDSYIEIMEQIFMKLNSLGIKCRKDTKSSSIGKRYSVIDEIGTPFVITIDELSKEEFVSNNSNLESVSVTLRERNSMEQKRISLPVLPKILRDLCEQSLDWQNIPK